jgi:hypothetical protein
MEVLLADQASDEESQETSAAIRKCRGSASAIYRLSTVSIFIAIFGIRVSLVELFAD